MQKKSSQKGVTLIEMMVSLAASTVIAYTIFAAIRLAQNQMDTANVSMAIQTSAREGLYRMVQEIRESAPTRIAITNNGATITFDVPNPSSPVTSSYDTDWDNSHQIQYARGGSNNSQVIRTNLTSGQTSVIANDVTGLTFTGNISQPTVVTLAMNVQRNLLSGRSIPETPLSIAGQAKVRND